MYDNFCGTGIYVVIIVLVIAAYCWYDRQRLHVLISQKISQKIPTMMARVDKIHIENGKVVGVDFDNNGKDGAYRYVSTARLVRDALDLINDNTLNLSIGLNRSDYGGLPQNPSSLNFAYSKRIGSEPTPGLSVIADFGFDNWGQGYEEETKKVMGAGQKPPSTSLAAFYGNTTLNTVRKDLQRIASENQHLLKVVSVSHGQTKPGDIWVQDTFMDMEKQTENYSFFVDTPGKFVNGMGHGYSGRTKRLLWSSRPLLIVKPEFVEHWFEKMVPWVHYAPVSADLSDLVRTIETLKANPDMATQIATNALDFARGYLTRQDEVERIAEIISNHVHHLAN